MLALRLLMLVVVLAIAYLLLLRPQPKTNDLSADLAASSPSAASPDAPHSQYKAAMDRAQAAAKQMQAQRAEADAQ